MICGRAIAADTSTVLVPPINDLCADAIPLTPGTTCSYTTGTFNGATITGVGPSCSSGASQDVWYKFTATDVTMSVGLNANSSLNHGFEIYQGGCSGTQVACTNAYPSGWGENYFNNNFIVGQEYHIRVFNVGTAATSTFQICVTKYPTPANDLCTNAQQLTPGTACTYTTGTFSGSLKDGGVPGCAANASQDVWYKFTATDVTMSVGVNQTSDLNHGFELYQGGCNGTLITCVNSYPEGWGENYFNNNFIVGQEYYVRVFNASSALQTRNFQICVTKYPTPANDLCANAQQLTPGTTCTYTTGTFSGSLKDGGVPGCAANASQDVWYKFTATDVTMSVGINQTSDLNHGFELYQGGCNGTLITCVNSYPEGWGENYFNNNFIVGQEYYVRVFNASSALQTRSFQICVTKYPTPANDLCANAQQLTPGTTCTYTSGTFSGSLKDGGVPGCAANASQDVWYKFTATDVTMSVGINQTSDLNHGFELYQGGCNGTLITCVNNYPDGWGENYFNNNFIVGQEYYVRVFNASSALQTRSFQICVTKYPPPANDLCANAIQLTPGLTCTNTSGTFSGALKDGGVPGCAVNASQDVWYKFTATDKMMEIDVDGASNVNVAFELYQGGCNGTLISCKNFYSNDTAEYYFASDFVIGQEYYIRVINPLSSLDTRNFQVCIIKYPPPANDLCANAIQLTPGLTCTNTSGTFSGSLKDGGVPGCAVNASQDVWYKFTATDKMMEIDVDGATNVNVAFELYQGGCNGTLVSCKNFYSNDTAEYYFASDFVIGQEYYIRVINPLSSLDTRNFQVCIIKYPPPANDLCANAVQLTPGTACNYITGTFSGSMMDGAIPACATGTQQDVWYKFIATDVTNSITLDMITSLNHGFEIIQGGCNGTVVACVNSGAAGAFESYYSNDFIPGQEYYIRVFNATNILPLSNFRICLTKYPTPANDLCANATEVFPGTTCSYVGGTFIGSTLDGPAACPAGTTSQDIWYKFVATEQTYSIYLNPVSFFNPGFQIFEGSCSGTPMACVNNFGSNTSEYYINNNFVVGQTYYVRFFHNMTGYSSDNISFCITKYPKPANDTCQNATLLTQNTTCSQVGGTFSGAMFDGPAISCAPQAGQDVWFRFIAEGASATIYIGPMLGRDLGFQVFQGGCTGTPIACVNSVGVNLSETGTASGLTQGQEYYIRVFNVYQGLTTDNFSICVYGAIQPCNASVSVAASATQVCSGSPVTFTATPVNGGGAPQYQWKVNGNNAGTNSPTFTTSTLANGAVVTVVMTSSVLCPTTPTVTSNAITITVTNPVTPAFTQVPAICLGGSFALPSTSTNGITGTWSPAVNTTATTTYTFTPDAGQCASTATMTVTVNNNIAPTFTQVAAICSGGSFTLPTTSNNGITGTWSPALNNTATTTYTFTPNAGQCAVTATMTVTVNNNTTPTFTQVAAICQGGSFTLPATSTNGITGTWSPAINNNATTTYVFQPNAGQCAVGTTMTVTVTPGTVPTFTQVAPICQGGSFTLPTTSTNGVTGTWSPAINNNATTTYTFTPAAGQCATTATTTVTVNNNVIPTFSQVAAICPGGSFTLPTTSTNGVTGTWSPAINNNATTTYTFTPAAGQCATTATMTVTVNNNVIPTFSQVAAICPGGSFTLPTTSTNGVTGTWSPAINNNATTTYTFTPNAGQCATTATMTVTVNNNITPVFSQVAAICPGGSFTLPTTSTNGVTGTWSPAINNNATTTYTFTPAAGQCATTATMTVTVNNNVIPTFSQVAAICPGGSFTLPTTSTNGVTGTWSPAINNNATTTYTFTPNAGQCATTATMTVTVNNNVTPVFSQVAAICPGGSFTLPTVSTNGITGTWSPAINNNATTTYTFTPNGGQCATTATMTVTVNNNVTPLFSQVAAICPGGSFTLPTVSTNGITGTWSPAINNNATTTYTFTPNAGQCATAATMTVTVNNNVTPIFSQVAAICPGGSFTLPTVSINGVTGTWSPAINNTATTTYTFMPNAGQCATTATMTVVVNSVNTALTVSGATITAAATGAGYQWINCTANQPINGATEASFTATANGSYAVIVTQNGCSATSECVVITDLGTEAFVKKGWKVYPNPVVDQLFVETEEATEIVITDMTGKTVSSQPLKSGVNTIDTGSLSAGMYFINSASGAHIKFIKR
ncbi:hypothetical protein HYN59_16450 [Flavobacterium album]|uniref:Uncharacterized protein n=2 Tax=Flavobacterium album TaxID=2175091 RepID=A0A2S1R1Q4_9FLAO|nr:hypothetical protein HYN59_16450 [Flavobacterium album]